MALDATSFGYVLAQQIDSFQENFIFNLSLGFYRRIGRWLLIQKLIEVNNKI